MMPDIKITDKAPSPPGVMPKHLQGIVITIVAGLILVSSYCSTLRVSKGPAPAQNSSPAQNPAGDLRALQELKREFDEAKRKADLEKRKLEPMLGQKQEPIPVAAPPAYAPAPAPKPVDPFEQERRRREAAAPFASSVAFSKREERLSAESKPALTPESLPAGTSATPKEAKTLAEAGRMLSPREGDLYRVYEGTMIDAILTNRLDGTFTGPVSCMIATNVYSPVDRALLIPAGSQVLGESKKVEYFGQHRLTVTFHRLRMPNGYSIDLTEVPGLNQVGETGLRDKVDNHYLRTFGVSAMLGLLGGLSLQGTRTGFDSTGIDAYRQGVSVSVGNSATRILDRFLNVLPTVTIREGHLMKVYLTRDLLLPGYRA